MADENTDNKNGRFQMGHGLQLALQFIGLVVLLVGPMMWWAMVQQSSIASLTARVDGLSNRLQSEHQEQQTFQSEMRTTMGTLAGQVGIMQGMLQVQNTKDPKR